MRVFGSIGLSDSSFSKKVSLVPFEVAAGMFVLPGSPSVFAMLKVDFIPFSRFSRLRISLALAMEL